MILKTRLLGQTYQFKNLKEVFAKANEEKSGDRLAGLCAETVQERIAAKQVLSEITLEEIRNHPLIPPEEDEVSRIIEESIDEDVFREIKNWSVARLREYILDEKNGSDELLRIGRGLSSEMIAAVTKLMSNMDLVYAANKIEVISECNIAIGQKGRLASRLQPNHPTDRVEGLSPRSRKASPMGWGMPLLASTRWMIR